MTDSDVIKKIRMPLVGEDGNAFAILGRYRREARRQGLGDDQINQVTSLAMAGDYNNLLSVMMEYTYDPEEDLRVDSMNDDDEWD